MASDAAILRKHQLADIGSRIRGVQEDIEELKNAPDVVDIVATKAALDAYDTSKLTDKDVIRVLVDETHDGASTYYRWAKATSTWTYIGKTGDYYTKTETDALLNAKADKATTYTKTETDTLLDAKADKSTTYTKTETDTLLGDKADKATTYTKTETDTLLGNKEGKTITGAGAPTTSTEAANVGQQYYDTTNEKLYYCSAIDTTTDPYTYTWEEMGGGGGIPTDAKLWNQSYDATNNRFQGELRVLAADAQGGGAGYGRVLSIVPNSSSPWNFYPNRWYGEFWNYYNWQTGNVSLYYRTTNTNDGGLMRSVFRFGYITGNTASTLSDNKSYTPFDMTSFKIYNVADPTNAQDAATKNYVDTAVASAGSAFTNAEFNNLLENA